MKGVFALGDFVRVNLEPVVGHERCGTARAALVLNGGTFNRRGEVLVTLVTHHPTYHPTYHPTLDPRRSRHAGPANPTLTHW